MPNLNPMPAIEAWFAAKGAAVATTFWGALDEMSMLAILGCLLLMLFGLEPPKKWSLWIIAIYVTLRFLQAAIGGM